ncbi:MAG: polysaccharide pyruvyl transferase family protein [Thiobacillaceae bacterium]
MAEDAPVILFGACDRHNLGDLLFPHIVEALVSPRPVIVAGVAERDLRAFGGHRVAALARLAAQWESDWGDRPAHLVHVGGELLTCSLYEAAVMTLPPTEAPTAIARFDQEEAGRQAWAEALLGLRQRVAYLAAKALFRRPGRFVHLALGGVDLPRLPAAMQAEVIERLRESDALTVRDRFTQAALAEAGLTAKLVPDPAELMAVLFGARIAAHAEASEPARVRERFPQGYVAVQFAAEFGDDATLLNLAAQLCRISTNTGLGLVLFRAGAAPWHDDLEVYRRLVGLMRGRNIWLIESLDIWDLCALLAQARLYLGSSLHGRIVASAFAVPGVNIVSPCQPGPVGKQAAYLATWHDVEPAGITAPDALAGAAAAALLQVADQLKTGARQRADAAFAATRATIHALADASS